MKYYSKHTTNCTFRYVHNVKWIHIKNHVIINWKLHKYCLQITNGSYIPDNEVNPLKIAIPAVSNGKKNPALFYQKRISQEVAPDGGWGWVICLATFLCHFVVGGTYYSYGIMLPHLIDQFNSDHVTISMIGSGELSIIYNIKKTMHKNWSTDTINMYI